MKNSRQASAPPSESYDHCVDIPPMYADLHHPVLLDKELPSYEEAVKL